MTFLEQLKDAFNRFFGYMEEPVPLWTAIAAMGAFIASLFVILALIEKENQKDDQEEELEEDDIPNPVVIRRQPAEIFETDCDLCGCGYRYTVEYVKEFTTICPNCGTRNPHGPQDTDIISRREPHE